MTNNQHLDGNKDGETGHGHETFAVPRFVRLLPHQERQPGLNDEGSRVHAREHHGAFFVVVLADFVGPSNRKPPPRMWREESANIEISPAEKVLAEMKGRT